MPQTPVEITKNLGFHTHFLGNQPKNNNFGVFLYDKEIYVSTGHEVPNKVMTYKFRIALSVGMGYYFSNDIAYKIENGVEPPFEVLEFTHTCNLNDFIVEETRRFPGKDTYKTKEISWRVLVNKAYREQYEEARNRLIRLLLYVVPEPVIHEGVHQGYGKGMEFLEFTPDTSSYLGGPFELEGKEGALAIIKELERTPYPTYDVRTGHSAYNLPDTTCKRFDDKWPYGHFANTHYKKSKEEKGEFFDALSIEEQHHTAREYYKRVGYNLNEYTESTLPFKIYMMGTDDCSYSKWFCTKEEAEKELEYLRVMQPLDFSKDIVDRGYIFTN